MLSPTHLRRLFGGLRECFDLSQVEEITFEANPATFTSKTAGLYQDLGVTRVSLGIQSFFEKHLETLGREHTPMQAIESVHQLREGSSVEVNIDLMFSLPDQSLVDWEDTLTQAIALQPEHLSAYNLTYEEDTEFFKRFRSGEYTDDPDLNAKMFTLSHELLTGLGYDHYETSNFALPGHRSRHNSGYWTGNDYLGLGPSGVSTVARQRWQNVADTQQYLKRVQSLGHAQDSAETLDEEAWRLERIALELRTTDGLPAQYLGQEGLKVAERLASEGYVRLSDNRLRLIGEGPLLVDAIAAELA